MAQSFVEALQRMKELEAQVDYLKAAAPSRLGWSVGCGGGLGYDLASPGANLEPFCGVLWGLRF